MKSQKSKSVLSRNWVITLLVLEFISVIIPVIILGKYFNFPDILRQPAATAFELFRKNQTPILIGYYIFLISAFLYIPLSYGLVRILYKTKNQTIKATFIGLSITTALFQAIGFVRWIFTMPYLTQIYFERPESRSNVVLIYEILNRYAGMSIGEHLGFISMGFWTICLGIILKKHPNVSKYSGFIGITIGVLLVVSTFEHFGGALAKVFGMLNFLANSLWSLWLIALIIMLKKKITS